MTVFHNGTFVQENDFSLSPFSRALHYGDGVFETIRSYNRSVFRFDRHMQRFFNGLKTLKIVTKLKQQDIYDAVRGLIRKNRLYDASIKILGFRHGADGPTPPSGAHADILILARPFDSTKKMLYERGIRACFASSRRNVHSVVTSIKSLNYLENILGRIEAREKGVDEALFLNTSGQIAEGATSNLFIVKNKKIVTPPLHAGILDGITRDVVIQLAKDKNIHCKEKDLFHDDLMRAEEAFLTNSLMEIMPLVLVDDRVIGDGKPGPVTLQMMTHYKESVQEALRD